MSPSYLDKFLTPPKKDEPATSYTPREGESKPITGPETHYDPAELAKLPQPQGRQWALERDTKRALRAVEKSDFEKAYNLPPGSKIGEALPTSDPNGFRYQVIPPPGTDPQGTDLATPPGAVAGPGAGLTSPLTSALPGPAQASSGYAQAFIPDRTKEVEQVRGLIKAGLTRGLSGEMKVQAVADAFGLPTDVVRQDLPKFEAMLRASDYDAEKWLNNPDTAILQQLARENPVAGPTITVNKELPELVKATRIGAWISGLSEAPFKLLNYATPEQIKAQQADIDWQNKWREKFFDFFNIDPKYRFMLPSVASTVAGLKAEVEASKKPIDLAPVPTEMRVGLPGMTERDEALRLATVTRDYHLALAQEHLEYMATGSVSAATSDNVLRLKRDSMPFDVKSQSFFDSVAAFIPRNYAGLGQNLGAATWWSAVAGFGVGGLTALATKNPAAGVSFGGAAARLTFTPAMILDMHTTARGAAWAAAKDLRLDNGEYLDRDAAAGLALVLATYDTAVMMSLLPGIMKSLGPAGELLAGKTAIEKIAVLNPFLKDASFLGTLRKIAGRTATSGAHISMQMASTVAAQEVGGWAARMHQGGAGEKFNMTRMNEGIAETIPGAFALAGLMAFPGAASDLVGAALQNAHHTDRVASTIQIIGKQRNMRLHPDDTMSPRIAAEVLRRQGIESVWVTTEKIREIGGEQSDALADKLLGPDGAKKLAAAEAAGEKVEVPVEQWSRTFFQETEGGMPGEKLAEDTTFSLKTPTLRELAEENQLAKEGSRKLQADYKALLEEQGIKIDPIDAWLDKKVRELESLKNLPEETIADWRKMQENLIFTLSHRAKKTPQEILLMSEHEFGKIAKDNAVEMAKPSDVGAKNKGAEIAEKVTKKAEKTVEQAKAALKKAEEAAVKAGGLPSWVRESMVRAGLDPKRILNDVDLGNESVRKAIMADPTLTPEQKAQVLKTGSPTPAPAPAPAAPAVKADPKVQAAIVKLEADLAKFKRSEAKKKGRSEAELDAAQDKIDALEAKIEAAKAKLETPAAPAEPAPVEVVQLTKKQIAAEKKAAKDAEKAAKAALIKAEEAKAKAKEDVAVAEHELQKTDLAREKQDPKVGQLLRDIRKIEKLLGEADTERTLMENSKRNMEKKGEKPTPDFMRRLESAKQRAEHLRSEHALMQMKVARLTGEPTVFNQLKDKVTKGSVAIIRRAADSLYRVLFTPNADYSTLMHESAHIYADMLGMLAAEKGAVPEIVALAEATKKWLGTDDLTKLTEPQAEKWAKTFESYLLEGKSPNASLAAVFQRARLFLTDVYAGSNELEKYKVDPTIRAIFDQMLATDKEIESYRAAHDIPPLFRSAAEAGMTGPQWAAYLKNRAESLAAGAQAAERSAIRRARRVTEIWWKQHYDVIRAKAASIFEKRMDYKARSFILYGEAFVEPHDVTLLYPVGYRITFVQKGKTYTGDVVAHREHPTSELPADNKTIVRIGTKTYTLTPEQITTQPKQAIGEPVNNTDVELRLDKAKTEAILTKEQKAKYEHRLVEDGVDPDNLARSHQFADAKAMFKAIDEMPGKERFADEEARLEMARRYPEIQLDRERLAELVEYSMKNRGTAEAAYSELGAMYSRTRHGIGGIPPKKSFDLAAEEILKISPAAKMTSARLITTEQRLSREALQAATQGNWSLAIVKKQQALLHHYLYRRMMDAKDQKRITDDVVKSTRKQEFRERVASGNRIFLDAIDILTESMGIFKETNEIWLAERGDFTSALERLDQQLVPRDFDATVIDTIISQKIPYKDLNYGQVLEVKKFINQFAREGRDFGTVVNEGKDVATTDFILQVGLDNIATPKAANEALVTGLKGPLHQTLQRAKGNFQAFTEPFYFIEKLGQTMEKFLIWRYNDARKLQDEMLGGKDVVGEDGKITRTPGIAQVMTNNWEKLPKEMRVRRFEPVDMTLLPRRPNLRVDWEADRQWMWMVHMMMGSETGKDRLTKGYGWSEAQVREFLKVNKMTEGEADFIQSMHDMFDKDLWGRIVETYTRNHGAPPKRTDAAPFEMTFTRPDGTEYTKQYRGGYTPVRYKDSFSFSSKDPDKFLMKDIYAGNEAAESVRASFTFPRDEAVTSNEVPILDWSLLPSHIAGVVHYVAFDAYVRDAAKILGDSRMKGIIQDRVGERGREQINAWLKDLAQDNLQPLRQATRDGWWWFNKAKSMFVNSVIMYNVPVFMGDVFPGPLVAIFNREVGAQYILPTMMHALRDPFTGWGMRNRAMDNSTVIPHRSNKSLDLFREIVYETSRYGKRGSGKVGSTQYMVTEKFNNVKHFVRHNGWVLMDIGDKMVSTVIWESGFKQALANAKREGKNLQDPAVYEAAVRAADKNVEHSLPSRDRSELPAMLREQQAMGNLVVFFGYASKMWQMSRRNWSPVYEHWRTQMEAEGRRAGKEQLVRDIIATTPEFVIAASYMMGFMMLTGPVAEFVSGRGPEDDETKGQWLGRKLISHPLQMLHPTTGWLGEMLGAGMVGKKQMPLLSMRTSPAASGLQRVVTGVTKAMSQPGGRAARDPHARMWAALDALLTMQSLPASQPTRTLKFLDGWLVDNTETQNPFAGVIYGPEKRASNVLRWPKR